MKKNSHLAVAAITFCVIITLLGIVALIPSARALGEGVAFEAWLHTSPSADAAYLRANRHFDATNADIYDIARAEVLLKKALEKDATRPLVRHQLARIEFLKGNFDGALLLIDQEIALPGGPASPSTYYVKGLIEGFKGDYVAAARDYEIYLRTDPRNWAAINDYAWVLLKNNEPKEALIALDWGLMFWPENPWLLNTRTTALSELGYTELAYLSAQRALISVELITEEKWLQAYPGNDPLIAKEGVKAFKAAVSENMHTMVLAFEESQKNVR